VVGATPATCAAPGGATHGVDRRGEHAAGLPRVVVRGEPRRPKQLARGVVAGEAVSQVCALRQPMRLVRGEPRRPKQLARGVVAGEAVSQVCALRQPMRLRSTAMKKLRIVMLRFGTW
jgi:uncharacterized protein YoaH (UPF0181 family)